MVERYRPPPIVGYMQPPEHTRFKKGKSGNPHGRPNKRTTMADIFDEELNATVWITENGKRVKMHKLQLILKQAVRQAMLGDFGPLAHATKLFDKLTEILRSAAKNAGKKISPAAFSKLTLDEKMQKMKELLAQTKPLSDY